MNDLQISNALDDVIKKFKSDASKCTDYCTPETFDAFKALSDSMVTALESMKAIIVTDKRN